MVEFFLNKIIAPVLAVGLLTLGSWACVSGGGGDGTGGPPGAVGNFKNAPGPGAFNPGNAAAPEDETSSTVAQFAPMPDVSVGASTDIVVDPDAPAYNFRVIGNVISWCTTANDPVAQKSQIRNFLLALGPTLLQAFEGCAYAAQQGNSYGPSPHAPTSDYNSPPTLVKVAIQGQLQYSVNGGEYKDWVPENVSGDRFLRVWDNHNNFVDTKIREGGKLDFSFTLRINNELTVARFNQAMDNLHFYKLPGAFVPPAPEQQKACNPIHLSCYHHATGKLHYGKIGALISADPNYGADGDFSNPLACID